MTIQAKLAAALIGILALLGGIWYVYHLGYEAGGDQVRTQWYDERTRIAQEQEAALKAYADAYTKAEEKHDADQITINNLAATADRVRIHLPTCPGNGASAKNQDGSAGVFSDRVDQLFADFQTRVGGLVARCDQLNIDAIRANAAR
jgi:hypothetical protein